MVQDRIANLVPGCSRTGRVCEIASLQEREELCNRCSRGLVSNSRKVLGHYSGNGRTAAQCLVDVCPPPLSASAGHELG